MTAICPSWVNTDMAAQAGCSLPPEEMIQPEDIMRTIDWLLSLSPAACVQDVVFILPQQYRRSVVRGREVRQPGSRMPQR